MIQDYEKTKGDLTYHIQKNEECVRELDAARAEKRNLEDAVRLVENELIQQKDRSKDLAAADSREIVKMRDQLSEKDKEV